MRATATRWIPVVVLVLSLIGIALVPLTIGRDAASYAWLTGQVGGSEVYTLNLFFARAVPFLIAAAIALAAWQRLRGRSREVVAQGQVRRHETTTVISHWVAALGLIVCLITAMWFVRWFSRPFEVETLYLLHFIGAALLLVVVAHHVTYDWVFGGRGLQPHLPEDLKPAAAEVLGYAGVFARKRSVLGIGLPLALRHPLQRVFVRRLGIAPAEEDKFLSSEKVFSYLPWVILIGVVVITGLIKAGRYVAPIPEPVLQVATFLHDGSLVWIIALLFFHVAALVLIPVNWPLLLSMVTTRVPLSYVAQYLPRWYRRLEAQNPGLAATPAAPAEPPRPSSLPGQPLPGSPP
ncbi:MAG: cytochrome b/b6 domain-containing protein [Chloroflexi bacterium]|nr:cytochrome b/b6 domain-containing protein [Chloroflexota bacterium]